jgi:hypothetical protein
MMLKKRLGKNEPDSDQTTSLMMSIVHNWEILDLYPAPPCQDEASHRKDYWNCYCECTQPPIKMIASAWNINIHILTKCAHEFSDVCEMGF